MVRLDQVQIALEPSASRALQERLRPEVEEIVDVRIEISVPRSELRELVALLMTGKREWEELVRALPWDETVG